MTVAPETYSFGCWQLHSRRRLLCANGARVPLNGRAFDMLALLVSRQGQVVRRDEIVAHVWGGLVVGENNLTVQMSTLRRVLGDDTDGASLIVTVPGHGYRFTGVLMDDNMLKPPAISTMATVTIDLPNPLPPERTTLWQLLRSRRTRFATVSGLFAALLGIGGVAYVVHGPAPIAPRLSIAVLPLRNLSPTHEQDYLADALTDDLTTDLAHIPGSIVIARESVETYRSQATAVENIGHALNVRYLVDGSLHIEDGRYFANVQLLDAVTGQHLWTSRLAPIQGQLSEVRNTIVRSISNALGFQLEQIESARSINDRPHDPDALDLFLRARAILDWDTSLPGLNHAQELLENAIAQQPKFGDALAELGAMLLTKVHDMDDPTSDQDYSLARQIIKRALEVAPRNARALAAHARALTFTGRWADAVVSANAALATEPSNADAESVLAKCAQAQGRLDDAVIHIEAALRLDPNSNLTKSHYVALGLIRLVKGQINEGLQAIHQAIAGEGDGVPTETMGRVEVGNLLLIAGLEMSGSHADAVSMYDKYRRSWENRTVWRFAALVDRSYTQMLGFQKLLTALEHAGMPHAADEHVSSLQATTPCNGGQFDPTPSRLVGGEVVDTSQMISRLRVEPQPILIDVGGGAAKPPPAFLYDEAETSETAENFALSVIEHNRARAESTSIILIGDGTYGCIAFTAAKYLIARGYPNVAWYRGGEEAWAAASQPFVDGRSE